MVAEVGPGIDLSIKHVDSVPYILYMLNTTYLMVMEDKVMGIGEFRANLADRIEAAAYRDESTVIEHGKRRNQLAALVPFAWLEELRAYRAANSATGD